MTHWLKARNVKITLAVFAVIVLFFWLAFDPLLKWGLVRAGEAAAGAKVDVGSLTTRVLQGRLTIRSLAVANKDDPMKNLFELEEAVFQFSPGQALRGKVVIPLAEIKGVQLGTTRKTSGALPLSKPGKLEKMVEKQLAPVEANLRTDAGKAKAVAAEVDPKKLESLKGLDAAQAKLGKAGDEFKSQVGVPQLDAQIKDIEAQIKQLQSGGTSAPELAAKSKKAIELQGRIKTLLDQVDKSRALVNGRLQDVQGQLKQAEDLRHKDVNGLLKAAGLPTLDAESLTRHLLGPAASKKVSTAVYWISFIRKHAASQSDKAAEKPPVRRRGINIEFPRPRGYPQFLLEKAAISGKVAALFQGRDMALDGTLTGVTSNPPLYGKPAQLALKGAVPGGGPAMGLQATLDQVKKPGATEIQLHYAGLPLAGMTLGDDELGGSLKGGVGRLDGTIRIVGEEWNGTVMLKGDGLSLAPQVSLKGPAAGFAQAALAGVRRLNMTIGISGTEDDLRFKISSDLGATVADGMKKAFSGEVEKQRRQLEAKIDALYAGRAKQLQAQSDDLSQKYLAPLDKQRAQLQDQLNRAVSRGLGRSIPGLEKLKLFK